jgi:IS4 transposase
VPDLYRLRWKIELLFKYFKTNGYNLEDLRITDLNKIRLMITLLTLACIFTILAGKDREKKSQQNRKSMQMDELLMLFRF